MRDRFKKMYSDTSGKLLFFLSKTHIIGEIITSDLYLSHDYMGKQRGIMRVENNQYIHK